MNDPIKLKKKTSTELAHKKQNPSSTCNPFKDLNNANPRLRHRSFTFSALARSKSTRPNSPRSAPPVRRTFPPTCSNPLPFDTPKAPCKPSRVLFNTKASNASKIGSCPVRTLPGGNPKVGSRKNCDLGGKSRIFALQLQSTPEKEGDRGPPIHSSISPEIMCLTKPPPACFAAGHLIADLSDRRKCRPRGILKVGEDCKEVDIGRELLSGDLDPSKEESGQSPHLVRASIKWLSSPSRELDRMFASDSGSGMQTSGACSGESTANWTAQPCGDVRFEETPCSAVDVWRTPSSTSSISPFSTIIKKAGACKDSRETSTPISDIDVRKTPSSTSSISPFSLILKKAGGCSCSGGLRQVSEIGANFCKQEMVKNHQVGNNTVLSAHKGGSIGENVEILASSSPDRFINLRSSLKLAGSSFQFGCPAVSSESSDLDLFWRPHCPDVAAVREVQLEEKTLPNSGRRMALRDGLVCRKGNLFGFADQDEMDSLGGEEDLELGSNCPTGGSAFGSIEYVYSHLQIGNGKDGENILP